MNTTGAGRTAHPVEYLGTRPFEADRRVHTDYALCGAGHAQIGDIRRAARQNLFIGGLYMGMRTADRPGASVKIEPQGFLLPRRLRMKINHGRNIRMCRQNPIGCTKWTIYRGKVLPPLEVYGKQPLPVLF